MESEDKNRGFKLWSFYWPLIIIVWTVFSYLEFIPYYEVLRLVFTIALVSPKINLLGTIFDSVLNEKMIKEKIDQAKSFVSEESKGIQG